MNESTAASPQTLAAGFAITPLRSTVMALAAVTAGVGMDLLAKAASIEASAAQVTLLRWVYGLMTLIPVLLVMRVRPGSVWRPIHLGRVLLNLVGSFCLYYSLAHLPLSVVVAVFFLEPLVALGLAALFLGEGISRAVAIGLFIASLGILLMTGLQDWRLDPILLVALLGAVAWGAMLVMTRSVGRHEPVLALMFWLSLLTSLAMAPFAIHGWRPLTWEGHLAMFGVAVLGTLYGVLGITVLRLAPVRIKAACSFLSLPLAFLAGFLFFDERPDWSAILGGILVVFGVWLALRLKRPKPAPATGFQPESP
nr:DMT family transporter [uncultured Dongia sp.]